MFHGSIVALVTPMDDLGQIDFDGLQRLVDFHLRSGTNGIVVAGTTGESATLSEFEFKQVLGMSNCRINIGRIYSQGRSRFSVKVGLLSHSFL